MPNICHYILCHHFEILYAYLYVKILVNIFISFEKDLYYAIVLYNKNKSKLKGKFKEMKIQKKFLDANVMLNI